MGASIIVVSSGHRPNECGERRDRGGSGRTRVRKRGEADGSRPQGQSFFTFLVTYLTIRIAASRLSWPVTRTSVLVTACCSNGRPQRKYAEVFPAQGVPATPHQRAAMALARGLQEDGPSGYLQGAHRQQRAQRKFLGSELADCHRR